MRSLLRHSFICNLYASLRANLLVHCDRDASAIQRFESHRGLTQGIFERNRSCQHEVIADSSDIRVFYLFYFYDQVTCLLIVFLVALSFENEGFLLRLARLNLDLFLPRK